MTSRYFFVAKPLPQSSQLYGFSPVWILSCSVTHSNEQRTASDSSDKSKSSLSYLTAGRTMVRLKRKILNANLFSCSYCLADHGQTIQSLAKCGSCHCIFRLLQTFLPLFSWKMIVNLNNQSSSQYLTEWLLIYFSDKIVRFFYCKTNHRSQQPHKSANKIIWAIISACYFALK